MTSDLSKYTIGWIAALHIELAAATVMLDKEHPKLPYDERDPNQYTLGHIREHNIVIACLPAGQTGTSAATAVATQMLNKFKSIRIGFLVGIGGGVPSPKADIRLGDVVVSLPDMGHGGVVQYDIGKAEAKGHFRRTGHLNTPPKLLLSVVTEARARYEVGESKHVQYLAKFSETTILKKRFSRNSTGQDKLFQPTYDHAGGTTCENCKSEMLLDRPLREVDGPSGADSTVEVHFGTIASGNMVMKDANMRDNISEQLGGHILCFEMEAAGLMNDFPCLVVRGICDYADSHKQDQWQRYAAATAAAYAREILMWTPSADVSVLDSIKPPDPAPAGILSQRAPFYVRFERNPTFVGRDSILLDLEKLMDSPNTCAAIWGLGGCGKSAVALEFAYRVHTHQPDRAILWIRASDRDHFEKALRDVAILYDIPGARDLEQNIMDAVRIKLMDNNTQKWLIVVDNADDPQILLSTDGPWDQRLRDYLPSRAGCKVLFTTRDKQAASQLVGASDPVLEVETFGLLEAQQLLIALVPNSEASPNSCIQDLLVELAYLPLAIVQAAAFIRENSTDIGNYLTLFREQTAEDQSTDVLGQEFEDMSRYPKVGNAVTKTWQISFKQLEIRNHLAFECLKHLACLAYSDIPDTLVFPQIQVSRLDRVKVIGTLVGYQFLVRQRQGNLFDTHRLVHLATRRWLRTNEVWRSYVQDAVATLSRSIPYGGYQEYNEYSMYLPHAKHLLGHIDDDMEENEATTDLLSRVAACQRDLGDYSGAERSHRAVLEWRQINLKYNEKRTLQALHDVGQDLMMRGLYQQAEAMHRATLNMRFFHYGPADTETLSSMRNVAEALCFRGEWEEYEMLSIELAKLSRAWLGSMHPLTLSSFKALSICYCRRGWTKLAEKLAREVVNGRTQAKGLGEMHPSTLRSISQLAMILVHNNNWEEAGKLESHVGKTFERILGPDHPDTLTSKCNLARIWKSFRED
ncbi:purine and uridine phosphorylase [Aureobasidium pullulans]|nr:purine and uridine phosphorylase [Aureobasidium pullulans]